MLEQQWILDIIIGKLILYNFIFSYVKIDSFDDNQTSRWYNFNDRTCEPINIDCPFTSDSVINIFYRLKKYSK